MTTPPEKFWERHAPLKTLPEIYLGRKVIPTFTDKDLLSKTIAESEYLTALLRAGTPLEEIERRASGALRLRQELGENPFYARRAAKWGGMEFWIEYQSGGIMIS